MHTAILHLSDIHFTSEKDVIFKRINSLTASLRPYLTHASTIIVAVTGDVAQSGDLKEYSAATKFLAELKAFFKKENSAPVHFVISPGNHDCDFRGDQSARQLVVDAVLRNSSPIPESYLKLATRVQGNYFSFRQKHETKSAIVQDDPLWTTYGVKSDGMTIALDALNASWISTRHEKQGGLLFPFELYEQRQHHEYDLRICLMHHPFNWYNQMNYRAFRGYIHRQSDIILTGHEHDSAVREIEDAEEGHCIYIEGEALQTGKSAGSGFNIILIDNSERKYRYETLRYSSGRYEPQKTADWDSFRPLGPKKTSKLQFSESYKSELRDPGANLKHFSGRELTLDDIFVFPDLDERSEDNGSARKARAPRLNSSFLANPEKLDSDILLKGDDQAGKTRLLLKLSSEYQSRGYFPIFLKCDRIKSIGSESVRATIEEAAKHQYGANNRLAFLQTSKTEKIALLDDFDRSQLNELKRSALLAELRKHFHRLIVTVGENFEVREIFGGDDLINLADMRSLKILPLGHARRLELIRKWNRIGTSESTSENEFLKACDEAVKLIESTKLRYVATTNPIFVLSLLQATASSVGSEMHNSSFAHYYYFLIVGALEKAKVSKQELNSVLSACTHLSWFLRINGHEQRISNNQYRQFVAEYSNEWSRTDPEKLLQTLVDARLLEMEGDSIAFSYPYSYYYFLGKYASISQEKSEVRDFISYCLKHLYARECANTLLFLAHHSGTSTVLNSVKATIDEKFDDLAPATLDRTDVQKISELLAYAPDIKFKDVRPSEYRERQAEESDRQPDAGDGLKDAPVEGGRNSFHDIVGLFKAIEIAGTLLTHQYSNYDRATKDAAIKSIFDGAMRAVKHFHGYFDNTHDLMKSLSGRLRSRFDEKTSTALEISIRNSIGYLIKVVTTTLVMKASSNLRSRELDDNISSIVEINPSLANRLIALSQELQRPTRLPRLEVDRLTSEHESNPAVMSVLQLLILQRLYMYETEHQDKHWAMSIFELGGNRTNLEINRLKLPRGVH